MEPPEGYEDLPEGKDAPEVDPKGHWKNEMALRVDKFILEQVEALEDKVTSASMQVPGWRVPNNGEIDSKFDKLFVDLLPTTSLSISSKKLRRFSYSFCL